jgi:hypothetical protein
MIHQLQVENFIQDNLNIFLEGEKIIEKTRKLTEVTKGFLPSAYLTFLLGGAATELFWYRWAEDEDFRRIGQVRHTEIVYTGKGRPTPLVGYFEND